MTSVLDMNKFLFLVYVNRARENNPHPTQKKKSKIFHSICNKWNDLFLIGSQLENRNIGNTFGEEDLFNEIALVDKYFSMCVV